MKALTRIASLLVMLSLLAGGAAVQPPPATAQAAPRAAPAPGDQQPLRFLLLRQKPGELPWLVHALLRYMAPAQVVPVVGMSGALWRLSRERFDAVLLDVQIPDRAMLERCRELIADVAAVPVLHLYDIAGEKSEAAQDLGAESQVGERCSADSGSVEREGAAEYLRVNPPDGLEQPQVRASQTLLLGDLDDHRGAGIALLVHRVSEAGNELSRGSPISHRFPGEVVPFRVGAGNRDAVRPVRLVQRAGQEAAGVLGDAQEA